MAGYLRVTNWSKYQHYKNRNPIWVKYYVDQLHSDKLKQLPLLARFLWTQMILLAAEFENAIPNDPELVGKLTGTCSERCTQREREAIREALDLLVKGRWLSQKQTRRSASKRASKAASNPARATSPPELEVEAEAEVDTELRKSFSTLRDNGARAHETEETLTTSYQDDIPF